MSARTAILHWTHFVNRKILERHRDLRESCEERFDVYLAVHGTREAIRVAQSELEDIHTLFIEGDEIFDRFGGPHTEPGDQRHPIAENNDLVPIFFQAHNPEYDFVWSVEFDVVYTGDWGDFFDQFSDSDADLLATSIVPYGTTPGWYHWPSLRRPDGSPPPEEHRIRAFLPLFRLSAPAMETLEEAYEAGWRGFSECSAPSILHSAGLTLEDIGGEGPFVAEENEDRFYTSTPTSTYLSPGTFVWKPVRLRPGDRPDTLYHPVKPLGTPSLWRQKAKELVHRARDLILGAPTDT